jgi:glycosyltransferase involved in cell wall biosynthesis
MIENIGKIRVCFFGFYDSNYSRNRIMMKGLRANGVSVFECKSEMVGIAKYIDLAKKHWKIRKDYDVLFVAYPGYMAILLAKLITRKKIMYDAFFSIYDSVVNDRAVARKFSIRGFYHWCIDYLSCAVADKIILDTNANIDYFVKTFGISRNKFIKVLVGSDDDLIFPKDVKKKSEDFLVHFHGGFNPMQGVLCIIKAINILKDENIKFRFVGRGQEHKYAINLVEKFGLNNIEFVSKKVSYEQLNEYMNESDLCLGIFGNNSKANIVIPNKAYEALAVRKPLITRDSKAIKELFVDGVHCVFCKPNDPEDLASKIMLLYKDKELRDKVAENGYDLFLDKLTPKLLTKDLPKHLEELNK